jgi:hypothetical protein
MHIGRFVLLEDSGQGREELGLTLVQVTEQLHKNAHVLLALAEQSGWRVLLGPRQVDTI